METTPTLLESSPKRSTPGLKRLHGKHREILRLYCVGTPYNEIAEIVGVSLICVRLTIESPLGQARIKEMQDALDEKTRDVQTAIIEGAARAQAYLEDIVVGREKVSPALRAKTCESMLDRAGYVKPTKNLNINLEGQLTAEDIAEINRRAQAASPFCRPQPTSATIEAVVSDDQS